MLWRKESCWRSCLCCWLRARLVRLPGCGPGSVLVSPRSPSIFIFTIFSVADCEPRCRLVLTGLTTNTCLHLPAEEGRLHSPVRQTRAGQDREELSSTTADQTSGFSHSPAELQELENINSDCYIYIPYPARFRPPLFIFSFLATELRANTSDIIIKDKAKWKCSSALQVLLLKIWSILSDFSKSIQTLMHSSTFLLQPVWVFYLIWHLIVTSYLYLSSYYINKSCQGGQLPGQISMRLIWRKQRVLIKETNKWKHFYILWREATLATRFFKQFESKKSKSKFTYRWSSE